MSLPCLNGDTLTREWHVNIKHVSFQPVVISRTSSSTGTWLGPTAGFLAAECAPTVRRVTFRPSRILHARFPLTGRPSFTPAGSGIGHRRRSPTRLGSPEGSIGHSTGRGPPYRSRRPADGRPAQRPRLDRLGIRRHAARAPLGGGAPREVLENVKGATGLPTAGPRRSCATSGDASVSSSLQPVHGYLRGRRQDQGRHPRHPGGAARMS